MLIIIFGLSGSGKNFVSNILVKHFGYYYCDADQLLPDNMLNIIESKQSFTQQMRDDFTQTIIQAIATHKVTHPKLVVAQGLYKNQNRLAIARAYPEARFIYLSAKSENRAMRLLGRNDKIDPDYAKMINANFEEPTHAHVLLNNDSDETEIIQKLKRLLPHIDA